MVDPRLQAALASWRALAAPDDDRCVQLFGIGLATIERIEAGDVLPEDDIAARIASVVFAHFDRGLE